LEEAIQAAYLDNEASAATTALEDITMTGSIESDGPQRVIGMQLTISNLFSLTINFIPTTRSNLTPSDL
jgi:hypothetical protein